MTAGTDQCPVSWAWVLGPLKYRPVKRASFLKSTRYRHPELVSGGRRFCLLNEANAQHYFPKITQKKGPALLQALFRIGS